MTKDIELPLSINEDVNIEVPEENSSIEKLVVVKDEVNQEVSGLNSLMGLNDSDEFFDVPESTDYDHFDNNQWHSDLSSEQLVL